MSTPKIICFSLVISTVLLGACGGGSSSTPAVALQPLDNEECGDREFFNDMVGTPAAYFNGHIPISSQTPQGTGSLNKVYEYDIPARRITETETNTFGPGSTTTTYLLDDVGRPLTRNRRVVNFAIQLDLVQPELRYNYDAEGLLTGYTQHSINGDNVASEPNITVDIDWSEVGGIKTLTTVSSGTGDFISSTTTYSYNCTTLLSAMVESDNRTQPDTVQNYTVQTTGSGKAVTTTTTLEAAGVQGQRLVFDTAGNLVDVRGQTINYEATDDQIVNIVLFEHALRYRGLL